MTTRRHTGVGEQQAEALEDLRLDGILREEQADRQRARRKRQAHRGMVALATLDHDVVHPAAGRLVDLPGRLPFDDREIVVEPRDRPYGHAVGDEHHRNPGSLRREIQRDAVRIAVAGHDRQLKRTGGKEIPVAPIVGDQLHHPEGAEDPVAAAQNTSEASRAPAIGHDASGRAFRRRTPRTSAAIETSAPSTSRSGTIRFQARDLAAFVRPAGRDRLPRRAQPSQRRRSISGRSAR